MSGKLPKDPNQGEKMQSFAAKSRSAPTTPRGDEESDSSGSQLSYDDMIKGMELIPKDMQIAFLKERLNFTLNQLGEKERQLEEYKRMVSTLQDVLGEVSANRQRVTQGRPPPGFEPKVQKYPIAGRKSFSDHMGTEKTWRTNKSVDEPQPFTEGQSTAHIGSSSNRQRSRSKESLPGMPFSSIPSTQPPLTSSQSSNKSGMTKSVSTNALSDHLQATEGIESNGPKKSSTTSSAAPSAANTHRSAPNVTIQRKPEVVGNAPPSSVAKKKDTLKKSQSMTSVYSVLEENRLDLKFPDLDQLVGQLYALSKYQQGCRFLQKKLEEKKPENTKVILGELFDHLVELMTDPFGNYLFTKLIEQCDPIQREKVISKILPEILTVAFDMYGTQSLQKMMPFLEEEQTDAVIGYLSQNPIPLIKHNKANYLVQHCLDKLSPEKNQWVYDTVLNHMEEIARDRVGCVIVKKCIGHANEQQKQALAAEISSKVLVLVQDPFGNYVVQHLLQTFPNESYTNLIIKNLLGNITDLCTQKFSSNVVEMCLKVAEKETRTPIIEEITNSEMLPQLLSDKFANFVIQTVLDVAEPEEREKLVKIMIPHLARHYSPYTKRLQKKILPAASQPIPEKQATD